MQLLHQPLKVGDRVLSHGDLYELGCVQDPEVWSTEEETHMCPGHFWICKFGTVPGTMSCVEKMFELQTRRWEEYKDTRYYDGDRVLVVELWLHRVADYFSGLTFQEWDPSSGTDDGSTVCVRLRLIVERPE